MIKHKFLTAGEQGIVVELGNTIDPDINKAVHSLNEAVNQQNIKGVRETVPTYRSLFIHFDPLQISRTELERAIEVLLRKKDDDVRQNRSEKKIVEIPVCYGGEYGPDIDYVSQYNNLEIKDVIDIHTSVDYLVYMLGFTPGFPYLGGLSSRLATPRLATPRALIPAGSVGIADRQTGVYPLDSPGGWQIIGRTPLLLFDLHRDNPFLLQAGNYIRFISINEEQYHDIKNNLSYAQE